VRKIDLHLHTVSTISDRPFTFSLDQLDWYVKEGKLDAIAITNHNMFDLHQFREIKERLKIKVFPGIEVDVDSTHILLISDDDELSDFKTKCDEITALIPDKDISITLDEFKKVFPDLSKYILIPHYKKSPEIKEQTLQGLSGFITAGEVTSARKFIYCIKDDNSLVPVCFSDLRIDDKLRTVPARQTYVDVGDITLNSLKLAFSDKHKVHLSSEEGHKFFDALNNGLKLSTGLNVILGERSTGKSHTLNLIAEQNDTEDVRVKYIKQFSLLQRDDGDDREFSKRLVTSQSQITQDYFKEFQEVVGLMRDVNLENSNRELDNFVNSLLKYSSEADKLDSFAKAKLFTESTFNLNDLASLKQLVNAAIILANNSEYQNVINKHISREQLKALAVELILEYNKRKESELQKSYVNDIIENIKSELQMRTAAAPVNEVDLFNYSLDLKKVEKFNLLCGIIKSEKEFLRKEIQGFSKIARRGAFNNAREVGSVLSKQASYIAAFNIYHLSGYDYLKELRKIDISGADYYKLFSKVTYEILNSSGYPVSGGEQSEFRLLQEISDATQFDLLLIDEPESSFDNKFLFNKVNKLIKEISGFMPVIIVTHNSTVGASIKADYLVYTCKNNNNGAIKYDLCTGHPSDRFLIGLDGARTDNHQVLLNCLEAGDDPYSERRKDYEVLKNS